MHTKVKACRTIPMLCQDAVEGELRKVGTSLWSRGPGGHRGALQGLLDLFPGVVGGCTGTSSIVIP